MNIVDTLVEVKFDEKSDQNNFLKVKETLTRIGVASIKQKTLYQSCHILHDRGRYYIVHFKELLALDGKTTNYSDEDRGRRNTIAFLLASWGLLEIINPDMVAEPRAPMKKIMIIPHKDKEKWVLETKYTMGKKRL